MSSTENIKPELDKIKTKLEQISNIAVGINHRQKQIITTATLVNNTMKLSIENEINNKTCEDNSNAKIKVLKERIEKSQTQLTQIKLKLKMLEQIANNKK